jgi:uncharacterized protein (DUF433 family)
VIGWTHSLDLGTVMRTRRTEYKHVFLWPDGTPTVSSTWLKVKHVAGLYRDGTSAEEIQRMFRDHSLAEIFSALAYYVDNEKQINRRMDDDEREADQLWSEIQVRQGPSPTRQLLEQRRHALGRAR